MSEHTADNDAPAVPYGPGWHHHNAGRLHRDGECPTCVIPPVKGDS